MSAAAILESLLASLTAGRSCALCTVISTRGSTPQVPGAMLLVHAAGAAEGTLGGGCVEAEVRRRALALLAEGRSALLTFDLDHDYGWDDGLICGGRMDVVVVAYSGSDAITALRQTIDCIRRRQRASLAIRVPHDGRTLEFIVNLETTPTLLIAGAGHIGAAVAKLAPPLDFRAVIIDDRADLLAPERLPPPIETVAGDIAGALRGFAVDANTYIVIVTRGHRHDQQALHAVIDSPARYIGMIGSRRKIKLIFDDLAELGVDRRKLERVHSPIGLDIGAITVPEIAVSIAAQLVQVRRAQSPAPVSGPFEIGAAS